MALKPIFTKKPLTADANTTVGDAISAGMEPSAESVPIAIREITARTHSINMEPYPIASASCS